jgi:hypothetical protein
MQKIYVLLLNFFKIVKICLLKLNFWQENFCIKILFWNHYMSKGKDPEPEAHKHTDPDTDPAQVHTTYTVYHS